MCFYCSRLLLDRSHPKIKDALSHTRTHAGKRLNAVYDLVKGRAVCEGVEEGADQVRHSSGDLFSRRTVRTPTWRRRQR